MICNGLLCGMVVFGLCAEDDKPGGLIDVSHYGDWILKTISETSGCCSKRNIGNEIEFFFLFVLLCIIKYKFILYLFILFTECFKF